MSADELESQKTLLLVLKQEMEFLNKFNTNEEAAAEALFESIRETDDQLIHGHNNEWKHAKDKESSSVCTISWRAYSYGRVWASDVRDGQDLSGCRVNGCKYEDMCTHPF